MSQKVYAVIAQKGGVGKTSGAVSIATYHYQRGARVLLIDFDPRNGSAARWHHARLAGRRNLDRLVLLVSNNFPQIEQAAKGFDVVVFDGLAYGSAVALEAAQYADRVIIPTNGDEDELEKAARFAYGLVKAGIKGQRIMFALNRANTDAKMADAASALQATGFAVSVGLRHKDGYASAMANGNALHEAGYESLREKGSAYVASLVLH